MFETLRKLISDESGASAVEYGLLVALIAVVAMVGIKSVGEKVLGAFNTAAGAM